MATPMATLRNFISAVPNARATSGRKTTARRGCSSRYGTTVTAACFPNRRAALCLALPAPAPSTAPSPEDGRGHTPLPEMIPMGAYARYRDTSGEISRKHGHTLIGTLRTSYGSRFAKNCDVLAKLDGPSVFKLVRDHKAGMLSIRLSTFLAG
jgi:hypothetical protein